MKLLIIGPYPVRNNGMSKYIAQYRAELLRLGHSVETETMYFWRDKWKFLAWIGLRSRLRRGFDAVIIQHTPTASGPLLPIFLGAARRAGVVTAVVGHEPPSIYARHLPPLLRPLYYAYERSVFDDASVGIVHTRFHAAELSALGVKKTPAIIPHPVFESEPGTAMTPRERSFWAYFGMVSPKKGLDSLLEAYQSRPPGSFPPLKILGQAAPGHEAHYAALKESVRAPYREHILFKGYVEDDALPAELASVSLMIFPYRWISQSGALAHAGLYRIPYLASDLPFFREFRERYGCGTLFNVGSTEALAAALDHAAADPFNGGDAAFERMLDDLSLARCAERLVKTVVATQDNFPRHTNGAIPET